MLKNIFKWIGIVLAAFLILFTTLLIIPEKEIVKPIQPRDSTQFWEMSEGFSIAYHYLQAEGSSDNPPVIYLHGGPGGYIHSSIIETLEELTNSGFDIYLYDQRGSGLSDRLPVFSDINFQAHVRDLDEIITRKIGAEKVTLIGQSFGANIAAHYSALNPDKINKIIFSSPGAITPPRIEDGKYVDFDSVYAIPDSIEFITPYNFVDDVDNMALKPKAMVATLGALLLDKKIISDTQMDRMLNTLASQFTRGMVCDTANVQPEEGGGGLYAYLATNNHDMQDVREQLKQVHSPVLILQGQCDYIPYSAAFEYVDLYPISKYELIEGAGHDIWWEKKEEYIKSIEQFLLTSK